MKTFPNAVVTHNAGDSQAVSVVALDNAGRGLLGVPMKLVITGAHAGEQAAATDNVNASFTKLRDSAAIKARRPEYPISLRRKCGMARTGLCRRFSS